MAAQRETDLYAPIRDFLIAQGYTVRSEVKNCDITARKGSDLIIIELKLRLSLDLLIQATDRQRITDLVYIGLPGPLDKSRKGRWKGLRHLLRRLEVGLIVVSPAQKVEVVLHPQPFRRKKVTRRKRAVLREMNNRSGDYNQGGSTRKKLVTAYRENAIFIACCLEQFETLAPRQLLILGTGKKTSSILRKNFYGWFERVKRGIYTLTPLGKAELESYPELVARYRKKLKEVT